MKRKKIRKLSGGTVHPMDLPWQEIYEGDKLLKKPIDIMQEIYDHEDVISFVAQVVKSMETKDVRKVSI